MSGFVGSRARKKRRNFFLSLVFIIFVAIIILFYPTTENNNNKIVPNDNIVPDPSTDLTSLASNIEDLELSLFQKDQKIKFRDGQIKNLKFELKKTKSQYDTVILELSEIKNDLNMLSSNNENLVASSEKFNSLQDKLTKLNLENDKNISKIKSLNKQIDEQNTNLQLVDNKTDDIISENQKLKKDNKSFFAKNIKLDNSVAELKQKIIEQQIVIDSYLEEIKKLKDTSHHGG
tara:strand:- start:106 stop:804 length:699 start_codon:yes stop_codon:yes gene_type:complete